MESQDFPLKYQIGGGDSSCQMLAIFGEIKTKNNDHNQKRKYIFLKQ
jgi:hypothetical protein